MDLHQFFLDESKPYEKELRIKFSNPNVSEWIEEIRDVPLHVHFVPNEHKSFEVYLAAVIEPTGKDLLQHFTEQQSVNYLRQLLKRSRSDSPNGLIFPRAYQTVEHAMDAFSLKFKAIPGTMNFYMVFESHMAEAFLRESATEAVIECIDSKSRVKAAQALFDDKTLMTLLPAKYKRFILEDGLGM